MTESTVIPESGSPMSAGLASGKFPPQLREVMFLAAAAAEVGETVSVGVASTKLPPQLREVMFLAAAAAELNPEADKSRKLGLMEIHANDVDSPPTGIPSTTPPGQLPLRSSLPRTVYIGYSPSGIYLRTDDHIKFSISAAQTPVFLHFVQCIAADEPQTRVVKNNVLNYAIGELESETASPRLRVTLSDLNLQFQQWFGLGKEQKCIKSKRHDHGYYLDPIIQWAIDPGQESEFKTETKNWMLLIDTKKLHTNTPDRGHPLLAPSSQAKTHEKDDD